MFDSYFALTRKMLQLGVSAQNVAALRLGHLAAGGTSSQAEFRRMIGEKFAALAEAQIIVAIGAVTGRSEHVTGKILHAYQKRVRANRRRLSRR